MKGTLVRDPVQGKQVKGTLVRDPVHCTRESSEGDLSQGSCTRFYLPCRCNYTEKVVF